MTQILRQCPIPVLELAEPKTNTTAGYVPWPLDGICFCDWPHVLRGPSYISGLTMLNL